MFVGFVTNIRYGCLVGVYFKLNWPWNTFQGCWRSSDWPGDVGDETSQLTWRQVCHCHLLKEIDGMGMVIGLAMLSVEWSLNYLALTDFGVDLVKCSGKTKKYKCRAHSQVNLGSGRSTLSVKPNAELRYRKLPNNKFLKYDLHFVAKDWFPQPTNLRTPLFSISDSMSTLLLNISRDGVSLGKGRLTAPSASLGEVSSCPFYSPPSK